MIGKGFLYGPPSCPKCKLPMHLISAFGKYTDRFHMLISRTTWGVGWFSPVNNIYSDKRKSCKLDQSNGYCHRKSALVELPRHVASFPFFSLFEVKVSPRFSPHIFYGFPLFLTLKLIFSPTTILINGQRSKKKVSKNCKTGVFCLKIFFKHLKFKI